MKYYIFALLTIILVLCTHMFGIEGIYFHYPFYDIIPHFIGGVSLGFFWYAILNTISSGNGKRYILHAIALSLLAGVIWEYFEIFYNIAGHPFGTIIYYFDTLKDLFLDTVGATLAIVVVHILDKPKV